MSGQISVCCVLCSLFTNLRGMAHFHRGVSLSHFQSRRRLAQIRAAESLRGRLGHPVEHHLVPSAGVCEQFQQEWQAILDHRVPAQFFMQFVQDIPALMPCPRFVPGQECLFEP